MKKRATLGTLAALICACSLFAVFTSTALAIAPAELTFKEPDKGSTFAYVDAAPKTTFNKQDQPKSISAGDQLVITKPVFENGKKIGALQASCIATRNSKTFAGADYTCSGIYNLKRGTLVASALIEGSKTEGAILGGTGIYAGATGTFIGVEHKSYETTVIKLGE